MGIIKLTNKDKAVLKIAAVGSAMSDWQMGGKTPIYDEVAIRETERQLFFQQQYIIAYNRLQKGLSPVKK